MRLAAISIVLVAALAGCLGGNTDETPPTTTPWYENAIPHVGTHDGHDHYDQSQHQGLSSPNFEIVGWDPLHSDLHGTTSGGYYCGETAEMEGRALVAYESFTTDVALVIVDITDPAAPVKVGELVLPRTHTYDAALSDDGTYAVLATSLPDTPDNGPVQLVDEMLTLAPVWRDACGNEFAGPEDEIPYASGLVLVDLSDLTAPRVSDYRPQPALGAHSVSDTIIDGTSWIIGSTTNLVHSTSYFRFYNVLDTPAGPLLTEAGSYDSQYPSQNLGGVTSALINGHVDAAIQKHPVTDQLIAYLANWNGGMIVLDVIAPGVLVPLTEWRGFGALHEAYPQEQLIGDKHITIVGQELGGRPSDDRSSGYIALLDTTDPANPAPVAWWTIPMDLEWQDVGFLGFSTHYPELHDNVLFVSHYHGGVWAADASPENWPALPTIGAFVPDRAPPTAPFAAGVAPEVLDVEALSDGTLVIPDAYSGVYTVRFDKNMDLPRVPALDLQPTFMAG